MKPILTVIFACLFFIGCATTKIKDLDYDQPDGPKLNVFYPKHPKADCPVLIFLHGGNWNSGHKDTYVLLGRNFARKGIVTVIPDYTLSPKADYDKMAKETAAVIHWVGKNIKQYKGNPDQIFVTGHSAGGHLAALSVMNAKYGIDPKSIAGLILNDAAGLDMKYYLEQNPPTSENDYLKTWSNDPVQWQQASPINFIDEDTPPIMVYVGTKTYESIKVGNARFLKALAPFQPDVKPVYLKKKHVPMVVQYFWPYSKRFGEIMKFMQDAVKSPVKSRKDQKE